MRLGFSEIAALSQGAVSSVIVFRTSHLRHAHVINRLAAVLDQSSQALESGAIITIEDTRHRVRRLPIGD